LLNGAVKPAGWSHAATQPLDPVYGAGMVNVYQSWLELEAGRQTAAVSTSANSSLQPPASLPSPSGWDLGSLPNGTTTNHYFFAAPLTGAASDALTATIDWNVTSWNTFTNNPIFNNLDLALYNVTTNTPSLVSISDSTVDNLQQVYVTGLVPGDSYDLRVYQASSPLSGGTTYGLAYLATANAPAYGVWVSAVSGSWSNSGNWTGGVPDVAGAAAAINASTTAALTVTLDAPQTVGTLLLGNSGSATKGYTLAGSGSNTLTLDNSGSNAAITVTGGSQAIDAPVVLADNLVIASGGTNSWTLSFGTAGSIAQSGSGSCSLTMSGAGGKLILSGSNDYTGGTIVTAGTLEVTAADALPSGTSLTVGADASQLFAEALPAAGHEYVVPVASDAQAAPEPAALALLAAAACGAAVYRRLILQRARHAPP
jgi:autotransporter-associated beta strand protein